MTNTQLSGSRRPRAVDIWRPNSNHFIAEAGRAATVLMSLQCFLRGHIQSGPDEGANIHAESRGPISQIYEKMKRTPAAG